MPKGKKKTTAEPLPFLAEIKLPPVNYPRDGFVKSGEIRPPKKGEYFTGILGYSLQAKRNFQLLYREILITERDYNRRLTTIVDQIEARKNNDIRGKGSSGRGNSKHPK